MNPGIQQMRERWRRTPKGIRWLVIAVALITTLYMVEDLWGRIAWRNYHQSWEERGVLITRSNPAISNVPADEDFWESEIMRKWEARSRDYDPAIPSTLSGDYRSFSYVKTKASRESNHLTTFNPRTGESVADCVQRARSEDLAHEVLFQALADGADRPQGRSFGDQVPNLGRISEAAKHTGDRVAVHLSSNDPERAARDLIAFIRFANHLREQALVGQLVNIAVCRILSDAIWEGLALQAYDEEQLIRLQTTLEEVRIARDFAQVAFQEMGWSRDVIDDPEIRKLLMSGIGAPFSRTTSDPFHELQSLVLHVVDVTAPKGRHMNAVIDNFSMWENVTLENGKIPDELTIEQSERLRAWKPGWRSRISFMRAAVPNLGRVGDSTLEAQQIFDFARIACALERYHLANKTYPDSLKILVPAFLSELPQDRFQPTLAVRYAKTANGRYQLHGSGTDQKDDGGNPADDLVWRYP